MTRDNGLGSGGEGETGFLKGCSGIGQDNRSGSVGRFPVGVGA